MDLASSSPSEIARAVEMVREAFEVLSPLEQKVVELAWGICGEAPRDEEEIALKLGLDRVEIERIEREANALLDRVASVKAAAQMLGAQD